MIPTRSAPSSSEASRRPSGAAVAAAAGATVVGLAVVGLGDPSRPGNAFPRCPFHAVTGLWCPGCGTLRAVHDVLHGHVLAGVGRNPLLVVLAPLVVWSVLAWLGVVRRPDPPAWALVALGVLVVAFTVLRNVAVSPLSGLAP